MPPKRKHKLSRVDGPESIPETFFKKPPPPPVSGNAPPSVPSLEFLCCAYLVNTDKESVITGYDRDKWGLPDCLAQSFPEDHPIVDAFKGNVHWSSAFGWCTVCLQFAAVGGHGAGACNRCLRTEKGRLEPTIVPSAARLLLRWGYTHGDQRGEKWLNDRAEMLTASDAAVPLGISQWSNSPTLFRTKLGLEKKENTTFGLFVMNRGTALEPEALAEYEKKTKARVYALGLIPHPTIPGLAGSPDGLTADGRLVEIKCPYKRTIVPGEVPHHYEPQVRLLMECLELDSADFVEYMPPRREFPPMPSKLYVTRMVRDPEWFANSLESFTTFVDVLRSGRHMIDIAQEYMLACMSGDKDAAKSAWKTWKTRKEFDAVFSVAVEWSVKKPKRASTRRAPSRPRQQPAEEDPGTIDPTENNDVCHL